MGFFELLPETTSYKVIVEHEGKQYDFNFSDILPAGYVMRINDTNEESYQIEISKSSVLPRDTIAVSVSCRGTVYAVEAMRLADAPMFSGYPNPGFRQVAYSLHYMIKKEISLPNACRSTLVL